MSSDPQIQVTIDDLYKYYDILATDTSGQNENTYLKIIKGTKAGTKEKLLASQFISRFFKLFPTQMPIAIDAIFDLCEDEDVNIRKSAIKDLASIGKDCSVEHLKRIADILTQLLQTEDVQEFNQVQLSLVTIMKINPQGTLNEMFNQINTAELDQVRKRAIKFLCAKVPQLFSDSENESHSMFNKSIEDLLVKNVKRILSDCDAEEFTMLVRLLASLTSMNTLLGRQELVAIIMEQSELDKKFNVDDLERIMILLSCIQQAIPLFSKNVHSNKYVGMFVDNVLAIFDQIADEEIKYEILKSFADLCTFYTPLANGGDKLSDKQLDSVYNTLLVYLPKAPVDAPASSQTEDTMDKDKVDDTEVRFNFSFVECLMYTFHLLVKCNQAFLSPDKLKDFRLRLQYFAKGTKNYIKELRNTLINSSLNATSNADNEQNKIRRVALKVTTNIDALIKDLFHNPPAYKTSITLSWKSSQSLEAQESQQPSKPNKRSLSVSNEASEPDGTARKKPERGIYQPPTGKYSTQNSSNAKRRTFSFDNKKFRNTSR